MLKNIKLPILIVGIIDSYKEQLKQELINNNSLVLSAQSGFQVLSILENYPRDIKSINSLIIIDNAIDMPAIELISLSRSIFNKELLKIVYIINDIDDKCIQEALTLGANSCILRPLNPKNLASKIL